MYPENVGIRKSVPILGGYFWGTKDSQKRWRVSIHLQYGSSTQRYIKASKYRRSTLPSSSEFNGRATNEGGVDTPKSFSVWISNQGTLESLSSFSSANYQLHYRWFNWDATGSRDFWWYNRFGYRNGYTGGHHTPKSQILRIIWSNLGKLNQTTQDYLIKNQRKRGVDGGRKDIEVTKKITSYWCIPIVPQTR